MPGLRSCQARLAKPRRLYIERPRRHGADIGARARLRVGIRRDRRSPPPRRARCDDVARTFERDAADGDDRLATACGIPHQIEAARAVAGVLRRASRRRVRRRCTSPARRAPRRSAWSSCVDSPTIVSCPDDAAARHRRQIVLADVDAGRPARRAMSARSLTMTRASNCARSATSRSASARNAAPEPAFCASCSSRAPPRGSASASAHRIEPRAAQTPMSMIG